MFYNCYPVFPKCESFYILMSLVFALLKHFALGLSCELRRHVALH